MVTLLHKNSMLFRALHVPSVRENMITDQSIARQYFAESGVPRLEIKVSRSLGESLSFNKVAR